MTDPMALSFLYGKRGKIKGRMKNGQYPVT
jgi:hypothetical protein